MTMLSLPLTEGSDDDAPVNSTNKAERIILHDTSSTSSPLDEGNVTGAAAAAAVDFATPMGSHLVGEHTTASPSSVDDDMIGDGITEKRINSVSAPLRLQSWARLW